MKTSFWFKPIIWWIYSAVAVTGVMATVYLVAQQNYRQSANDPQIQLAQEYATRLAQGEAPASVVPQGMPPTDLQNSVSTWAVVYDASGSPLESTAELDGAPPQPPKGLFDESTWSKLKTWVTPAGNETRVTWQKDDVRQAIVLVHYQSNQTEGYVVVGRSLQLTEERIIQLGVHVLIAWLFTLGCLLVLSFVNYSVLKK